MRPIIRSNLVPITGGLKIADLRTLAQNEPDMFIHKVQAGGEAGHILLENLRDLRSLYMALADVPVKVLAEINGVQRSVMTTAFPVLTSAAVVSQINKAYQAVESFGDQLVTDFDDNKKVTTLTQVNTLDKNVDEVKERADFPEVGTSEENVEIRHRKNGRKITFSAESILENDLPDIVLRTNALGELAGEWIEEQTLARVTDYYGTATTPAEPYVYRPNGTGTSLFSATANTPGARAPSGNQVQNNAFVDETDLDAARTRLATMLNERGKRVAVPRSLIQILCPDAIVSTIMKVINSEYVPGVENEISNWGPRGMWNIPAARVVSTPKLDDLSPTAWYYGAFKLQFKRKWKMRMETVTLGMDTQAYLNSMTAFQARLAWDVEIGATDYIYVIQNLAATTAPYDD